MSKQPYGRVDDYSCFNEYGHENIHALLDSIKNQNTEKTIEFCQKLQGHGSYEDESMEALAFAKEIGNPQIIDAVTANCGYLALNITTGNYTTAVYPTNSSELTITSCGVPSEDL